MPVVCNAETIVRVKRGIPFAICVINKGGHFSVASTQEKVTIKNGPKCPHTKDADKIMC